MLDWLLGWLLRGRGHRPSPRATQYLRKLAQEVGDPIVTQWIWANHAWEYDGIPLGITEPLGQAGTIRISLNTRVLEDPTSVSSQFAALHELGHLRQLQSGESPGGLFTATLYSQELRASGFGLHVLRRSSDSLIESRFKCHAYHHVLAAEGTFPFVLHLVGLALFFLGSCYVFGKYVFKASPLDLLPNRRR